MFARSPWFLVNRLSGGTESGSAPTRASDHDDTISLGGFEMMDDDDGGRPLVASGPSSSSRGESSGIASSGLHLGGGVWCASKKNQDAYIAYIHIFK